ADRRRAPVLDRRGPDRVRQRLRDLAAEVADREVRRLPDPRGPAVRAGDADDGHQEEDPRPQRGAAVRPRRAGGGRRRRGWGGGRAGRLRAAEPGMITAEAVLVALSGVRDPEIDESLTDLRFVAGVDVDGADVRVHLRLPTYFCA